MAYQIGLISLGCAKNQINSEQMLWLLQQAGMTLTTELYDADVVVVNTCGFIEQAKSEAIDQILALGQMKAGGWQGKIVVAGCLSQRYRDEMLAELPEIDALLGVGSFPEIVKAVYGVMEGDCPSLFGDINAPVPEEGRILTTPKAWAYLKIAEGCDNCCAYCIIPSLRGKFRSRPMENILDEAKRLAEEGVRELIIVAQDTSRYGTDLYGGRRLAELLSKLCEIEEFAWIRLHYLYPDEIDDDLIDVIAEEEKIIKYLDIPIQHINNKILKAMNRRGTGDDIRSLFRKLREKIPGLVLRTSLIVGLPGEGEAEFEELCDFLREYRIERAGVFCYSPEEGTPAEQMSNRPDEETARIRLEQLTALQSDIMDDFNQELQSKTLTVLCEGYDEERGCLWGRSYADSPEIDGRVLFAGHDGLVQEFIKVRITGAADGDLLGEIL